MQSSTAETSPGAHDFDFANILFGGPCNQRCPYCIGRQLPPPLTRNNLGEYPPANLSYFAELLREYHVGQLVLTGTNTDPQLYEHEERLVHWLRERLPGIQLSLHTNGQLALSKMDILNLYDRVTISFPSFDTGTFRAMTGARHVPDLSRIVQAARIPAKVSRVLTKRNVGQVEDYLAHCQEIGVQRLVFRRLYGDSRRWEVFRGMEPVTFYRGNPAYAYPGLQVTYWDFAYSTSSSLNLSSDGSISSRYLLVPTERPYAAREGGGT